MTIETLMIGLFGLSAVSALIVALTSNQRVEGVREKQQTKKSTHVRDEPNR